MIPQIQKWIGFSDGFINGINDIVVSAPKNWYPNDVKIAELNIL